MGGLIKREDVFRELAYAAPEQMADGEWLALTISKIPTAEKSGNWVDGRGEPIDDLFSVICSECGEWSEYRTKYCPHCGALMEGK